MPNVNLFMITFNLTHFRVAEFFVLFVAVQSSVLTS